ncbi:MAG: TPM domain-containing protein [Desulfovibrionaceae bacterium]|nr:TPM domain-containing protein [Desulfovibrionaceae bacterium]
MFFRKLPGHHHPSGHHHLLGHHHPLGHPHPLGHHHPSEHHHSKPSITFLRLILVLGLVSLVVWAFWINSERYVHRFNAGARLVDEYGVFSKDESEAVVRIIAGLEKSYNIKLQVRTASKIFTTADAMAAEIVFGICPEKQQVAIFVPPFLRGAVGPDIAAQMREQVIATRFEPGWPQTAVRSLLFLESHLKSLRS